MCASSYSLLIKIAPAEKPDHNKKLDGFESEHQVLSKYFHRSEDLDRCRYSGAEKNCYKMSLYLILQEKSEILNNETSETTLVWRIKTYRHYKDPEYRKLGN